MAARPMLRELTAAIEALGGEEYVFERLMNGERLKPIAESLGVTHYLLRNWLNQDETRLATYRAIREILAEAKLDDILDLADAAPAVNPLTGQVDSGWVQYMRNRIDATKWVMAKDSARLSDRNDTTISLQVNTVIDNLVRMVRSKTPKLADPRNVQDATVVGPRTLAAMAKREDDSGL